MRKLMWFTIGFALLCAADAYGVITGWRIPCIFAVTLMAAGLVGRRQNGFRALVFVVAGFFSALCWVNLYRSVYLAPVLSLDGAETPLTITASDYSYDTGYGLGVDGTIEFDGKTYAIRAYLDESREVPAVSPGDVIRGSFQVATTVPGGREESDYHQSKGIFLLGYSRGEWLLTRPEAVSLREYPAILTERIRGILQSAFPEDVTAFAQALLLGDSTGLDYETNTALKLSGIRHVIAVSGLHISVLYGFLEVLTGRRRYLTALVGIPVLLFFAAMVGFTPSVTRSCIMVMLMMLARILGKQYDSATALSFACLAMLLVNPHVITSASLQMSVGCVAGILLFQKPIKEWILERLPGHGRWRGALSGSIAVSIGAMSLVTPLSACYFGCISLVGILTNLLTLWVVSFAFIGIMLVCMLHFLWAGAAAGLGWLLAWPMRYVLLAAEILSGFPFGAVYTASGYIVAWLVFCYCLLALHLLGRRGKPGISVWLGAMGLCIALLVSALEPLGDDVRITMLDVGYGQSILIQSGGKNILVDCGGSSDMETADTVSETLLSQGISRLDGIILTGYGQCHAGALENLLTRIRTDLLILPDTPDRLEAPPGAERVFYLWDGGQIITDTGKITVYGPIFHGISQENTLCVLFESEKCDILITGDRTAAGEGMLLRKANLPDVDILVAGYHGAKSASSEELLRACTPETVLISAGEHSYYKHPNPELLIRLQQWGLQIRRTDLEGNIIIRR